MAAMRDSPEIVRQQGHLLQQRPTSVARSSIKAGASGAEALEDQAVAEMDAAAQRVYAAARAAFPDRNDPMVVFAESVISAAAANARASRLLNKASALRLRDILDREAAGGGFAPVRTLSSSTLIDAGGNDVDGVNRTLDGGARHQHQGRPEWRRMLWAAAAVLLIGVGIGGERWRAGGRSESSLSQRVAGLSHADRAWVDAGIDALYAGRSDGSYAIEVLVGMPEADRSLAVRYSQIGTLQFRSAFMAIAELAARNSADPKFASRYPGCLLAGPSGQFRDSETMRTCLVEAPSSLVEADTTLREYYGRPAPHARR